MKRLGSVLQPTLFAVSPDDKAAIFPLRVELSQSTLGERRAEIGVSSHRPPRG
jgi:hypothetical protein